MLAQGNALEIVPRDDFQPQRGGTHFLQWPARIGLGPPRSYINLSRWKCLTESNRWLTFVPYVSHRHACARCIVRPNLVLQPWISMKFLTMEWWCGIQSGDESERLDAYQWLNNWICNLWCHHYLQNRNLLFVEFSFVLNRAKFAWIPGIVLFDNDSTVSGEFLWF